MSLGDANREGRLRSFPRYKPCMRADGGDAVGGRKASYDQASLSMRSSDGAKWLALPAERSPWWMATQTFTRWSQLDVQQHLLALAQDDGRDMTSLDAISVKSSRGDQEDVTAPERDKHEVSGRSHGVSGTATCTTTDSVGRAVTFSHQGMYELPNAVYLLAACANVPL